MSAPIPQAAFQNGAVRGGVLNRKERPWTDGELEYVARNLPLYTYAQIAAGLGRSRSSVASAVRRMRGVSDNRAGRADSRRDATRAGREKRVDQVAELLAEGFALSDIAEELGITRDAVKSAFKKIKARLGAQAV